MNNRDRKLGDAFSSPDARFHAATLRTLEQIHASEARKANSALHRSGHPREERGRTQSVAPLRVLLVAAVLLAALTATGLATGVFQGIFERMSGFWSESPASDYVHMSQTAATDMFEQTFDFDSGARATLRLEQSYYNGEQLALGWSLQPEDGFAWVYDKDDPRYADIHPTQEIQEDGTTRIQDIDLYERLGQERADEFYRRLGEDGWAGVAWYDCYLGDGIVLPGVSGVERGFDGSVTESTGDARPELSNWGSWRENGNYVLYQEFDSLPEEARARDSLSVRMKAYAHLMWYCEDANGKYLGEASYEDAIDDVRSATVELTRSENFQSREDQFTASFPECSVNIELRTTPIHVEFDWESRLPDQWRAIWSDPANFPDDRYPAAFPEDVFYRCAFYAEVNGELIHLPEHYRSDELPLRGAGSFVLPDGATAIHVRPVYYNSGEHPDQDAVLKLD